MTRSRRQGGCPRAARGLWIRSGHQRPRQVSANADRLGDLRDGNISWFDHFPGDHWRLRVSRIVGPATTVSTGNLDCCPLAGGLLQRQHVYWTEFSNYGVTLHRKKTTGENSGYESLSPTNEFPSPDSAIYSGLEPDAGFAVDGPRIFYVDDLGVFEMAGNEVHWDTAESS